MTGNSEEGAVELSETSHLSSRERPLGAIGVGNIRREAEGSETVLSAEVSIPGYSISGFHLWYRIREECGRASDASANCFLAAMLPIAMEVQRPL